MLFKISNNIIKCSDDKNCSFPKFCKEMTCLTNGVPLEILFKCKNVKCSFSADNKLYSQEVLEEISCTIIPYFVFLISTLSLIKINNFNDNAYIHKIFEKMRQYIINCSSIINNIIYNENPNIWTPFVCENLYFCIDFCPKSFKEKYKTYEIQQVYMLQINYSNITKYIKNHMLEISKDYHDNILLIQPQIKVPKIIQDKIKKNLDKSKISK